MKNLLYILFLLLPALTNAQVNLDSLWGVWNDETQADTNRLKAMNKISYEGYVFTQPDSAFYFAQLQLDFAKEKGQKKYIAYAVNTQGVSFYLQGDYAKAIEYYSQSLKIREEIGDKKGIATSLNNIGIIYYAKGESAKAIEYYSQSLKIKEEIGDKKGIAMSLNNIGMIYNDQGDYAKAIDYYTQSLKIKEEIGDKKGMAASLNNIGTIYDVQGESAKAIEYYSQSLKIKEEIGDKKGIAMSLNNFGIIYHAQGDYAKAIEYLSQSLKIYEEIGDKNGIALSLNNIGNIYNDQGESTKAIDYYSQSLKIYEEIGDKNGIALSLNNIGNIYNVQGESAKAIDYYSQSLKIKEEIGYKKGMASSLNNIGIIYHDQGDYASAFEYSHSSLTIAQEIGAALQIKSAASSLWKVNKKLGRYKESLEMYELFIATRDSIDSEANQKAVIQQEYKYAYEKQAAADSITNAEADKVKDALLTAEKAENKQHQLEATAQKQQAYFLYGGLGLALLFGGFIFNRFRVTSKQKGIIEQQKGKVDEAFDALEEKNREIMDSISYAKRIQSAILPPAKIVKEYLQDSFILYKPKDVVAGDFYWMEQKNGKILFAAADCTGHGVPGAMVSVVCNNGLNRSVREHSLTIPGEILDKTREIVVQEFEKSEEDVKDGMDIALCSIEGMKLQYAGAYNPLWIIRNGEIIETKANKQPIGNFDKQLPYTTHTFELEKGDAIYIFSDGYVDQFGGEKEKKFKAKAFKKLLLSLQDKSMEEQKIVIDETFETWKGNLEQIDDVCVIGVRI
jgi:tetratricopeptide (TPR) repeat protein/serine phosphatase RsbU (regulator of sigma subunit)